MDSVLRSLWLARAWTGLPLLGVSWVTVAVDPDRWTVGIALSCGIVELIAAAGSARVSVALSRGDTGEILMRNGARVPLPGWSRPTNEFSRKTARPLSTPLT